MEYKVTEYEIANNIYVPEANEDPYSYNEKFATDLTRALALMNDEYKAQIEANNQNHDIVQAAVTLSEPVGGKQCKGFNSFFEAWAQAAATGKDFTIIGYTNVASDEKLGYNPGNLNKDKYCFTKAPYGFLVKSGRTVTVNLTGHTFNTTATPGSIAPFGLQGNVNFTLKNCTIGSGRNAIYVYDWDNVNTVLENVTIDGCTFTNNMAHRGGALYLMERFGKTETQFVKNSAFNNKAHEGSAIYLESARGMKAKLENEWNNRGQNYRDGVDGSNDVSFGIYAFGTYN